MTKLLLGFGVLLCLSSDAALKFAPFYKENMVLQRDRPIVVLGSANPGATIRAEFMNTRAEGTADADGRFRVTLPTQKVCREAQALSIACGDEKVALTNLLVGDVWVCSGQSNMEWQLQNCNATQDVLTADFPLIRHWKIFNTTALDPVPFDKMACGNCTSATDGKVHNWTAVGFYFARKVFQETGVPIGLLNASWGGTPIQAWMPEEAFAGNPHFETNRIVFANRSEIFKQNAAVEAAHKIRQAATNTWLRPPVPPWGHHSPTAIYNAVIDGITAFPICGVIWYQGENNATDKFYDERMIAMVQSWRAKWGIDFPFYFVQLAAHMDASDDPNNIGWEWAGLRERQTKAWKAIPNSGMAIAIDIGEAKDVHPKNKLDVGERLARWALHDCYGQKDVVVSGPLFKDVQYQDSCATVRFTYAESGLMVGRKDSVAPVVEDKATPLTGFAVKSKDTGKWSWANAEIKGNEVILTHPQGEPVNGARYAYQSNPKVNFYNRAGLPGVPFNAE